MRISSGELIIGELNPEATETVNERCQSEVVAINYPYSIVPTSDGMVMVKWNLFSKNTFSLVATQHIIYVDFPTPETIDSYLKVMTDSMIDASNNTSSKIRH
jgi:hypothetical protein